MKKLLLLTLLLTHFVVIAQLDKPEGKLDQNGFRTGEWKTYRTELLYSVGNYEAGKRTGEWKFYHRNGKLSTIGKYENDEQTGEWKTYHTNGKIASKAHLENDTLIDIQYYDKQGKPIKSGKLLPIK